MSAAYSVILNRTEDFEEFIGKLEGRSWRSGRAQVRPFVITFKVKEGTVTFISFKHHDRAYN